MRIAKLREKLKMGSGWYETATGPKMTEIFDHNDYETIVFIDSMIALECKPLDKLQWSDVGGTGRILVMVVPQVNTEIDKRKRDGRLGKRAREFNRLIASAAESGFPEIISKGSPEVSVCVARCSRIDWDALEEFDPQEGDHKVVAQIIHAKGIPNERKVLLSQDTNPIFLASSKNIKCRRLPEGWLLDPEPHPKEKELTRLNQRVRELEASEPQIEISVAFDVDKPLTVYRVPPLGDEEQEALIAGLVGKNSRIQQKTNPFLVGIDPQHDSDYDGKYDRFIKKDIPRYASRVHADIERVYAQFPFRLEVSNIGKIQAEELIASLRTSGGSIHNKFVMDSVFPPIAPRPEPYKMYTPNFNVQDFHRPHRDRHEVVFIDEPDGGDSIEFQCSDFRHGRLWIFDGIGTYMMEDDGLFQIKVEVTAANIRGIKTFDFELACNVTQREVKDLVNVDDRHFLQEFPMFETYNDAITRNDYDWFESPKRG